MAGCQAGLLLPAQTVLQHVHALLPVNTAANSLQTGQLRTQDHCSWPADCIAGWQAGLLVPVQTALQYRQVLLP